MKNKLLAVSAIFGMVASASAVKVNNNLSINGFIDGSYVLTESSSQGEGAAAAAGDQGNNDLDDQNLGLDEVELNFVVNVGNVSGLVAVDSTDTDGNENLNIEQAHFTYNINDAVSVTFGRYGSALGFEGEDPAGLYTFSRAYSDESGFNLANIDNAVVEGITVAYSGETYSIGASIEESGKGTDLENNDLNLELAFSYTGIAGVNIGGGYFFDNNDQTGVDAGEADILNLHISRQFGKLLLAAEYSEIDRNGFEDIAGGLTAAQRNTDSDAYLLLADYDFSAKFGVAVRLSNAELIGTDGDYEKFTVAPNYAITESLGAIFEYSDIENGTNNKSEEYAVELTYTF
jgi:hypothetical protein